MWTAAMVMMCALVATGSLNAQQVGAGRVVGRVLDAQTGRGIAGARVGVEHGSVSAISGVEGRYELRNVPAGATSLSIGAAGYATKTVTGLQIAPGSAVSLDVALAPQSFYWRRSRYQRLPSAGA